MANAVLVAKRNLGLGLKLRTQDLEKKGREAGRQEGRKAAREGRKTEAGRQECREAWRQEGREAGDFLTTDRKKHYLIFLLAVPAVTAMPAVPALPVVPAVPAVPAEFSRACSSGCACNATYLSIR